MCGKRITQKLDSFTVHEGAGGEGEVSTGAGDGGGTETGRFVWLSTRIAFGRGLAVSAYWKTAPYFLK